MPPHNEINSLFYLSINTLVDCFISSWFNKRFSKCTGCETSLNIFLEQFMPYDIVDVIVQEIIKCYVKKYKLYFEGSCSKSLLPTVSDLMEAVVVPQLKSLNLETVVYVGGVDEEDFVDFEEILISRIPILKNVTELSLSTHGLNITLPICSDRILKEIGSYCSNLKKLGMSFNSQVTDSGLDYLIPNEEWIGCPHLEIVFLHECSVTSWGILNILEGLPKLQIVGYKGMGDVLISLHDKYVKDNDERIGTGLKLTHISHLKRQSRKVDVCKMLRNVRILCPDLQNFKVRLFDYEVPYLDIFNNLLSLEVIYNVQKPLSPGPGTYTYLDCCGGQLNSLTLICGTFQISFLKVIGKNCLNIKQLWIRSNNLMLDGDLESEEHNDQYFVHLESLYFRVGETEYEEYVLPVFVLTYVLRNSRCLKELRLLCRNVLATDLWLKVLWENFDPTNLRKLVIALPRHNYYRGSLNLTLSSVSRILDKCCSLQHLENLLVWRVSQDECEELRSMVKKNNWNLTLTYRIMNIT